MNLLIILLLTPPSTQTVNLFLDFNKLIFSINFKAFSLNICPETPGFLILKISIC